MSLFLKLKLRNWNYKKTVAVDSYNKDLFKMARPCETLEVLFDIPHPDQLEKVEVNGLLEYMQFSPADQILPRTPPMRGRQTFSRRETFKYNRRVQSEPSPGIVRAEEQPNFNELFDWMEDYDDDAHPHLFTSIRHSLGRAEEEIRTYTRDYFLYNLTLTGAYIAFALMFGIILAYLIHSNLHNHHENFQSYYDNVNNSNVTKNLTHFQKQQEFANFLEYKVKVKCAQYQFDWETSSKCRMKNEEYLERIHMMEDELSDLRQQFSEKLTLKQETINKLLNAVIKHKDDHFFIRKSSVNQVLMSLLYLCWGGSSGYVAYRYFYHSRLVWIYEMYMMGISVKMF